MDVFKIVGAAGLLVISTGILLKSRRNRNIMFIIGGLCLEIYSIHIRDVIFMILQMVFVLSAAYDLAKSSL